MTDTAPHVHISLTTIDSRVETVDQTIATLLAQDHRNLSVVLHLSRDPYLLDKGVKTLPPALTRLLAQDPRFSIRWTANMGPYRKLLPLLAALGGRSALVATADDDTLYPTDWLSTMVRLHDRYRCVIAYRAHQIVTVRGKLAPYGTWMGAEIVRNPDLMLLPTGKDGILYHTAYFPPGVLDYPAARRTAPTADDVWFRWHTAMANVPVYCISMDYKQGTFKSTDERPVSLYHAFNRDGGNDDIISRIDRWAKASHGFDIVAAQQDGGHYRVSQ